MKGEKDFMHVLEKFAYGNGTQAVPFGNRTRPYIPVVSLIFTFRVLSHLEAEIIISLVHPLEYGMLTSLIQSCPTSNCTWPLYDTLGVCSQCADVSSELTFACRESRVDWTSNLRGGFGHERGFPNATMCGYFLNAARDSPVLMSGYVADSGAIRNGEALLTRMLPLTQMFLKEPLYGNGSIHFKQLRNSLVDFLIVSAAESLASKVYRNATPVAKECFLSWCDKRITSEYGSGEYVEKVTDTFVNTMAGDWLWIATPFGDENDNGTDIFYLQEININVDVIQGEGHLINFGLHNRTHSSIATGFTDILPSSTTVVKVSAIPLLRYKTWSRNFTWNRELEFNTWLAPNNVSKHMERWAVALTNVLRSAPSRTMLQGNAFSKETFFSMRWAWLAFPFTLLLFSLVFLVCKIVKTSTLR